MWSVRPFIFLLFYTLICGTLQVLLRRKIAHGGVSFTRIQKYTNETLPMLLNMSSYSLGVDILMVADYSTFQGFTDISDGDLSMGEVYTHEYLRALFEQVKTIYNHMEIAKQTIQLNLINAFVTLREDDCPLAFQSDERAYDSNATLDNSTSVGSDLDKANITVLTLSMSATEALDKFSRWLRKHERFLPKHDHAILITKYDLLSTRGDSSTQGLAYVGNICHPGDSASVVEDIGGAATALVAAHELGHSLGAPHDGNPESEECSSSENFLMATTVSGAENFELFAHSRMMSPCSVKSIENKLKSSSTNCIRKAHATNKKVKKESLQTSEISKSPGQSIGLLQQCQITFGPHYGICPNKEYFRGFDLCRRVWCKDRTKRRNEPCETKTYFPALDGTECGRTKWCMAGRCVDDPRKLSECADLNAKTCRMYSKAKLRHYCKAKEFAEICCRSCAQLKDY